MSINRKALFMNFIFMDVVLMGFVTGYLVHIYPGSVAWATGVVIAVSSVLSMFSGMILAFMQARDKTKQEVKDALNEQEIIFQRRLQELVSNERILCGQISASMARAVADRVANKIVAKYVSGMSDDSTREAVLGNVERIVSEEVCTLQEAIEEQAEEQGEKAGVK